MQFQNQPSPLNLFFRRQIPVIIFLILAAVGTVFLFYRLSPTQDSNVVSVAVAGSGQGLSANIRKPVAGRPFLQRVSQSTGPVSIALIVGHQGSDSGAVCEDGLTELEINTGIAAQTQTLLESKDIPTILFDEFDNRLTTYDGLALVSIHADSCGEFGPSASGFKTAVSSYADNGRLKECIESNYISATGMGVHADTITTHMTDYHAFRKIPANVPAIIVETGFMGMDRQLLQSGSGPAEGIANGIVCFLNQ